MGQIVPYSAAAFHELYLFLVDAHNAAVAVGLAVDTDYKTVRQRSGLSAVADSGHRASRRDNIAEIAQQTENSFGIHRIGIFVLDSFQLAGKTAVHVVGSEFVDVSLAVFEGIFAHPHAGGKFVAVEILQRRFVGLIERIDFRFSAHGSGGLVISGGKVEHFPAVPQDTGTKSASNVDKYFHGCRSAPIINSVNGPSANGSAG